VRGADQGGVPSFIGAEQLSAALSWTEAVDALEEAFLAESAPGPARAHLAVPGGELLLMPAAGGEGVGVKLVTLAPGNAEFGLPFIHGVYVLFAPGTLAAAAVFDGAALTAVRTAAVSALATRRLARADARRLVVFGAGTQARAHVAAMRSVRPIEHVAIVGRDPARAAALVAELAGDGLDAVAAGPEAVTAADVVCTCTTSREPLFAASRLPAGVHINAIGAYRPDMRELPPEALLRGLLVVETRESALLEAGDVLLAIADGVLTEDAVRHELAEVVRGTVGRAGPDQVTVFKSVGLALEDLAVAAAAARRLGVAPAGRPAPVG
jgi:ornithine cyclodeaminase/alanine dehydrogenase-like protein (mu-crystallin family)